MQLEIRRVPIRKAYAQNGNVGHATVYYQWWIYQDGQYLGSERLLRDAKAYLNESYPGQKIVTSRSDAICHSNTGRNDY